MSGDVQVTRLRISYVAVRIHDDLEEIGDPAAFARRLANPQPVRGLQITLPFGEAFPLETEFWSRILDGNALSTPVSDSMAKKLRKAGVPLRYRMHLAMAEDIRGVEKPILEAHLHSFGVAVMATVDLTWPEPVPLGDEVRDRAQEVEDASAVITVADQEKRTKLGQAAAMAVASLTQVLTTNDQGTSWDMLPHRLATVISGVIAEPLRVMPIARSPLHLALHWLSADDNVLDVPEPAKAFVAQWNGSGYSWPPSRLVYMLQSGTSTLSVEATAPKRHAWQSGTSNWHRLLLLQSAYITALSGLVRAAQERTSSDFPELAKPAAQRLCRLYGPAERYAVWGLNPRALMTLTDVSNDIRQILGTEPTASENYQVSEYG